MGSVLKVFVIYLLLVPQALVQEKPPPIGSLAYFVGGTWIGEGEIPGRGSYHSERTYEWTLKNNWVQVTHALKVDTYDVTEILMLGYDPRRKTIGVWGFGSDGSSLQGAVTSSAGRVMVYEGVSTSPGVTQWRATVTQVSDDRMRWALEVKDAGGWKPLLTTDYKRVKTTDLRRPPSPRD